MDKRDVPPVLLTDSSSPPAPGPRELTMTDRAAINRSVSPGIVRSTASTPAPGAGHGSVQGRLVQPGRRPTNYGEVTTDVLYLNRRGSRLTPVSRVTMPAFSEAPTETRCELDFPSVESMRIFPTIQDEHRGATFKRRMGHPVEPAHGSGGHTVGPRRDRAPRAERRG